MKPAIIFDLDGTLWDATGCGAEIWNGILKKYGITDLHMTRENSKPLMGKTMEEIGALLFPTFDHEKRMAILDEFGQEEVRYLEVHGGELYEGMVETVTELSKDYALFIVSNSQDGYVPAFLKYHQLGHLFVDLEMSGRTGLDKGSNIRLVMERNGIRDAVYIGDTDGDERAARAAGIPFIYAAYGFGKVKAPDAVIADIRELPACMKGMKT